MQFKQYSNYKNSGVEWLGDVPKHWDVKPNKYVFKIQKRIAGTLGFNVLSITQKGLKIKDIESNDGQMAQDYSKYQIVNVGDFAMNHMDLLTGWIDIAKVKGVTSPDYRVFEIKNQKVNKNFFLHLFQLGYRNKILFAYGQGAAQMGRWRLQSGVFNNLKLPYPSINEQNKIVSFLDSETIRIDNLITKQGKLIKLLKESVIAIAMSEQLHGEGKLVRLCHIVHEVARPVHLSENEKYVALGLYNRGRGLFHKPPTLGKNIGDSDFFYVDSGDLILSGQFAWEGAVAMASNAERGCVVSHRHPILRGSVVNTEYLFALFMSEYGDYLLNDCSRGSAGRNRPLNKKILLKQKIRIPSDQAQKKIKKMLEQKVRLEITVIKTIEKLKEYRSSIISHAVTGKIDVRE